MIQTHFLHIHSECSHGDLLARCKDPQQNHDHAVSTHLIFKYIYPSAEQY